MLLDPDSGIMDALRSLAELVAENSEVLAPLLHLLEIAYR